MVLMLTYLHYNTVMQVTIYHNPRCSKSRQTLALIEERGIQPRVVEYLRDPPDGATLARLAALLGLRPIEFARRNEAAFREAGLDREGVDDDAVLAAMAVHPSLIERPIVVVDDAKAVIGRPPERVLEIL